MLTITGPLEPTSETTPGGNVNIHDIAVFFKGNSWTKMNLCKFAEVLDCTFQAGFKMNDTGEEV
jgi:hypothetical protein